MDVSSDTADITLRTPADLLSAVPYLVGYQPHERFILIGLDEREIQVVCGAPLPGARSPVEELPVSASMLRHNEVTAAVLVGYGPPERVTRCVDHVRQLLRTTGVELVDALRVTEGRYWSYVCARSGCCPPEGSPLQAPHSTVDAAFALNGVQALPSRETVAARLEPVSGKESEEVSLATEQLMQRFDTHGEPSVAHEALRTEGREILARVIDGTLPPPREVVTLGAALNDPHLRGEAMIAIDHTGPQRGLDSWVWVIRHVHTEYRAIPAALLAYAAWRAGNGVLAAEAVRQALDIESECGLARMLGRILSEGLPPSAIPKLTHGPSATDDSSPATLSSPE